MKTAFITGASGGIGSEIAKRFHISPEAVRAENDCGGDSLTAPRLLLIPNVR